MNQHQDSRFGVKKSRYPKGVLFGDGIDRKVDIYKVQLDALKPWITVRVTLMLELEDEVLISYIVNQLEEKQFPDAKELQVNLTGFLSAQNARIFVAELWQQLVDAQSRDLGLQTCTESNKCENGKFTLTQSNRLDNEAALQSTLGDRTVVQSPFTIDKSPSSRIKFSSHQHAKRSKTKSPEQCSRIKPLMKGSRSKDHRSPQRRIWTHSRKTHRSSKHRTRSRSRSRSYSSSSTDVFQFIGDSRIAVRNSLDRKQSVDGTPKQDGSDPANFSVGRSSSKKHSKKHCKKHPTSKRMEDAAKHKIGSQTESGSCSHSSSSTMTTATSFELQRSKKRRVTSGEHLSKAKKVKKTKHSTKRGEKRRSSTRKSDKVTDLNHAAESLRSGQAFSSELKSAAATIHVDDDVTLIVNNNLRLPAVGRADTSETQHSEPAQFRAEKNEIECEIARLLIARRTAYRPSTCE